MISLTEDNRMLGYGALNRYPGVFHFVTTRQGGFSEGNYASFNCSAYSGDDKARVDKNRELLLSSFPEAMGELVIPFQTHGTVVRLIDPAYVEAFPEKRTEMLTGVDAMVTALSGYCLCVSTADCIPLLLYDTKNRAVGVVHAGWRGTVNHITARTLDIMGEAFGTKGEDVIACIGPGISLDSFEVGDEVYEAFREAGFHMSRMAAKYPDTGKWHIDLWEANRMQLLSAGVLPANIELAGICTYHNHEQFFSARRLGIASGRILSGIMLK